LSNKSINIITLGCSKNLVDSEHLLARFRASGLTLKFGDNEPADVVIINTCGFILDAKEESINTIFDFMNAKEQGLIKKLYVMGCLSERYAGELEKELPEVDRFFGKFDFDGIISELNIEKQNNLLTDRVLTTPSHYAYLKIAEGCDRSCAFCAIPQFTGKHKSVPVEVLVEEATKLALEGVKELLLISQELTYYGIDLYGERKLPELISRLSHIDGIEWIRLHYAYPAGFPMDLLAVIRDNPKVCKYLDIPLQHISTKVLKNMRRNIDEEQTRELVKRIREEVPGIVLRTTMLVGYPGEAEADFDKLVGFIREAKFYRLGVFPYSHEEGTWGYKKFRDDIPQKKKQERADYLMEVQQLISEELTAQKIGSTQKVIIDRLEGEYYIGRTEFDSPEVDGEVLIEKKAPLKIGKFYNIKIIGSDIFDLYGAMEHAPYTTFSS
jgi:ribosomal protein S12 methylthiotransferase